MIKVSTLQKTLLSLAVTAAFAAPAMADQQYTYTDKTITVDDTPMAVLRIYDAGQTVVFPGSSINQKEDGKEAVTRIPTAAHQEATVKALSYVKSVFGVPKTVPVIETIGNDDDNAAFDSPSITKDGGATRLSTYFTGSSANSDWPTGMLLLGTLDIKDADIKPLVSHGTGTAMGSIILHEFMHGLGIFADGELNKPITNVSTFAEHLRDIYGQSFQQGKVVQIQGKEKVSKIEGFTLLNKDAFSGTYFTGTNVQEVLTVGGKTTDIAWPDDAQVARVPGIPINGLEYDEDENGKRVRISELSHLELQNSMMSHQDYRNWGTFMEAELAVLQDIGYNIDRSKFFGLSIYNDELTLENTKGFDSTQSRGIGLHVYGSNNTITQQAAIQTTGNYAYGIRVDGVGNKITVADGTSVKANGIEGYGILVSYGNGHNIDVNGTVEATGDGGNALRFDFGGNLLGDETEYRGSYLQIKQNDEGEWVNISDETKTILGALQGPLVNTVNISGSIKGKQAGIYISDNALVKNINIMSGSNVQGDIISEWNPDGCAYGTYDSKMYLDLPKGVTKADLYTDLSFGVAKDGKPDADFSMTYNGNITGPYGLNVALNGKELNYGGTAIVHNLTTMAGSTLNLNNKAVVSANTIAADGLVTTAENSTVAIGVRDTDGEASFAEIQNNGLLALSTDNVSADTITINNLIGSGNINLGLDSDNADQLGGSSTVATAQAGADILNIEHNNTVKGYAIHAEEGDVTGEITATADTKGNIISASEKKNSAAVALTDIASNNFQVFRAQMNDLDKRMGDLRTMPKSDGAWAKVIAGQSQYKSVHSTYQTLQAGVDHRVGNFFGGVTASYTDADGTFHHGSTDDNNYVFGLYGGWLGDDGQFVDVTLKRHHLTSDYDFRSDIGRKSKGSYDTSGTSFSVEYGKRFNIADTNYYVEPQVEFMYGHLNSVGYTTSRGVKVDQGSIKSKVGRLGIAAGWVSPDKAGSAYIKASVLNDWDADSTIHMSKNGTSRRYHEDMGGTWGELAIGGTYNLAKDWSIYGEAETTAGNPVRTTYQFNAGIRYNFE